MKNITATLAKLPEGQFLCKEVPVAQSSLRGLLDDGYLQRVGYQTVHYGGSDLRRSTGKARKTYRASVYQLTAIGLRRRAKGLR